MFIKGYNNKIPLLWKASESMLRPLNGKKAYIVRLDSKKQSISTISSDTNPQQLSKRAKFVHALFFLTIIPPLFLLIVRKAFRAKYEVNEKISALKKKMVEFSRLAAFPRQPASANVIFERNAGIYSFLDNAANQYIKLVPHQQWQTPAAKNFLYFELQRITNELHNLEIDCIADHTLKPMVTSLKMDIQKSMVELKPGHNPAPLKPEGIKNMGNSCYINAALQPLLALKDLLQLLPQKLQQFPNESPINFEKRQKIYEAFNELLLIHKKNANPQALGDQVAELRKRFFQFALDEGGFLDPSMEMDMADSGSFFELLMHVIGWSVREKEISIPIDANNADMAYRKTESTPRSVILLKHQGSIQEAIAKYSEPVISNAGGWKVDITKDLAIPAMQKRNTTYIEGDPPAVLVFRIEYRVIDPSLDDRIDASPLFEKAPATKDATYELVGFCQNQYQIHWTSVIKMEGKWKYCNDSVIKTVNPGEEEFRHPANYAVYRKVQI